jgi:hypothetical protein
MTQTGGLTVLLAWAIFGALLAVLAYLLLRHEKDPCKTSLPPPPTSPNPRLAAHFLPAARQAVRSAAARQPTANRTAALPPACQEIELPGLRRPDGLVPDSPGRSASNANQSRTGGSAERTTTIATA